jgi:hypothetical protein
MEEIMAQDNAARRDEGDEQDQGGHSRSLSKKAPTIVYDNGHGTRVKRWDEGISNIMIERSYKPKDATEYVTEKVSLTPEEALGIIFGLQKGCRADDGKTCRQARGGPGLIRRGAERQGPPVPAGGPSFCHDGHATTP